MMDGESLPEIFAHSEFGQTNLAGGSATSSSAADDDIFSVLEAWEAVSALNPMTPMEETMSSTKLVSQKSISSSTTAALQESENELNVETSPKCKRQKFNVPTTTTMASSAQEANNSNNNNNDNNQDGLQRMTHITVERNRRKQMNDHLSVLRSLMPCFYVKRGDQASIIGGVVSYINELQQVLQSLEAKKQRKVYSEVLSPRILTSPRSSQLSPRKLPLSPRLSLPISPRTPQRPSFPYKQPPGRLQQGGSLPSPSCSSSTTTASSNINDSVNEVVAQSKSAIAEVEVKFAGPNLLLKTVSPPIPGQVVKIISALEDLSLEILQLHISNVDDTTAIHSFTIKIGIECQLSAEELAHNIQQTFC